MFHVCHCLQVCPCVLAVVFSFTGVLEAVLAVFSLHIAALLPSVNIYCSYRDSRQYEKYMPSYFVCKDITEKFSLNKAARFSLIVHKFGLTIKVDTTQKSNLF